MATYYSGLTLKELESVNIISGGIGGGGTPIEVVLKTVPTDEFWELFVIGIGGSATGYRIRDQFGNVIYDNNAPYGITIWPGWTIRYYNDGGGSNPINFRSWVKKYVRPV